MGSPLKNIRLILVPVDFSDVTNRLTETAANIATKLGSRIRLIHVMEVEMPVVSSEPHLLPVMEPGIPRIYDTEKRQLESLRSNVESHEVVVEAEHIPGFAASEIVEQAKKHHADLIIMGSHGHGAVYNLLVGSAANAVLKLAPCPVLIVPARERES